MRKIFIGFKDFIQIKGILVKFQTGETMNGKCEIF